MAKTVYNAIVQTGNPDKGNKGFIAYHKINSLDKFIQFLDKEHPDWLFAHIYNHKTREHIRMISPDDVKI